MNSRDQQPRFGGPVALFQTHAVQVGGALRQQYAVSGDGQRFLINVAADEATSNPITVLLSWRPVRP